MQQDHLSSSFFFHVPFNDVGVAALDVFGSFPAACFAVCALHGLHEDQSQQDGDVPYFDISYGGVLKKSKPERFKDLPKNDNYITCSKNDLQKAMVILSEKCHH